MKAKDASHEIHCYEKTPADVTWGWGVVFSSKTLDYLSSSDPVVHERLQSQLNKWTDVVLPYQGQEVRVCGNPFSAIARLQILKTLQERCTELGVHMYFDHPIDDVESLRDCDLLVGADGIGSVVRETYKEHFQPKIGIGKNKFIWLGTHQLFTGLTMGFTESEFGPFACHAYRFNEDTSTFIAECTEETWKKAGLDTASEEESLAILGRVFARELGGKPLLSNRSSWINFREVKNAHWHHKNVVLLGDALHTAHFSIGSGTKLAMEDSIVLARLLAEGKSVAETLVNFEKERRPAVEKIQRAAATSQVWFENMGEKMGPDPHLFAYDCMTRSGRVDMDLLREQDPVFVDAYERARAAADG
jgi:anthraniloyl-CoA monooxygenase